LASQMNKQILLGSVAVAMLVAVFIRAGFSIVPVVSRVGDANMSATCSQVKIGMTLSAANEVLHRQNRYDYEVFNGSDEYVYYGSGGGCRIAIDPQSGRITNATFNLPNPLDKQAMSP